MPIRSGKGEIRGSCDKNKLHTHKVFTKNAGKNIREHNKVYTNFYSSIILILIIRPINGKIKAFVIN